MFLCVVCIWFSYVNINFIRKIALLSFDGWKLFFCVYLPVNFEMMKIYVYSWESFQIFSRPIQAHCNVNMGERANNNGRFLVDFLLQIAPSECCQRRLSWARLGGNFLKNSWKQSETHQDYCTLADDERLWVLRISTWNFQLKLWTLDKQHELLQHELRKWGKIIN